MANLHTITWKGKEHTLPITNIANLTGRSVTFLTVRLSEGLTMQEAVDRVPGDPAHRKKRNSPQGGKSSEQMRQAKQERFYKNNSDIIRRFTCGGLRSV